RVRLRRVLPGTRPARPARPARRPRLAGLGLPADRPRRRRGRHARLAYRRPSLQEHGIVKVIQTQDLRKEFDVRVRKGRLRRERRVVPAVDGVDLVVERGEMLGYLGPNGAGKSTTLKMLTGVLTPTGGQVSVCGLTPVPQRIRLARRIGVVF